LLLITYGLSRLVSGAVDEALAHLTESVRLADQSGNTFLQLIARVGLAHALPFAGQLREALAMGDEVERLCGGDPEVGAGHTFSPYGTVLTNRAVALAWLGRLGVAAATAGRAIEIARRRQDTEMLVMGHLAGELACELAGDLEGALGHGRQAVEGATSASGAIRVAALTILGRAHLLAGDWPHSVEAMTGALAIMWERRVALNLEGWHLAVLAEASLGAGDPGGAGRLPTWRSPAPGNATRASSRSWRCSRGPGCAARPTARTGRPGSRPPCATRWPWWRRPRRGPARRSSTSSARRWRTSSATRPPASASCARRTGSSPRWARRRGRSRWRGNWDRAPSPPRGFPARVGLDRRAASGAYPWAPRRGASR